MRELLRSAFTVSLVVAGFFVGISSRAYATPPAQEVSATSLEDLIIPRKPIPYALLGVNAFVNDSRFGTIGAQFNDVKSTLRLKKVRVLFSWNDQIQPTRSAQPYFTFYDQIINALPSGTEALVIVTGVPSWMNNSANWIDGDPRKTFVELWVKKVAQRYGKRARVGGFQIWNEPNNPSFSENLTLDVLTKPDNYVDLLARAHGVVKAVAPTKKVVNAATTAIAQNFPNTLNYNKSLVSAGILSFTDVFAIHYYGKNPERVLFGGIADFLQSISKPIWITETGMKGVNKQREYAERIFAFLKSQVPGIERIYLYQYTESTPADATYGLRNLTPGRTVSDLYITLRDRP
jgi:hypothetical protein